MALDREALFAALFGRLQTIGGLATFSRINLGWDECVAADQPALYLVKGDEDVREVSMMPPVWEITADVNIFCRNTDTSAAPSTQLNDLIQKVEAALEMTDAEATAPGAEFPTRLTGQWGTTLGGLCAHCWISGKILVWEGAEGGQAAAVIPITMLATA